MKNIMVVLGLLFLFCSAEAAETAYTKRADNYVREGPGSYFTLIAVVPENSAVTIQESKANWLKVHLSDKKSGWMSANSLTETKPASARIVAVEKLWSSPKASRAGVSAAIRGFAEKRDKTPPGSVENVLKNSVKTFGEAEFVAFRQPLLPPRAALENVMTFEDLDLPTPVYDAGISEQQIGLGVAARLSTKGFVTAPALVQYVNMIAAALAEQSPAYDWDFSVYVLDDSTVNGFALPGGYIFITKGALQMCADESEAAAIIAHEMAHVTRKHGVQEISKRKVHIKADDAFAELEEDTGEKSADEAEMDELVHKTYEQIVAPRLFSYELEADRVAAVLLARTGYDPYGLVRIAEKVARIPREKPDMFDPGYMAPDNLSKRAKATGAFVDEHFAATKNGSRLRERFIEATSRIR
ncbi:MAG: peptidase Ste24p [Bacteroidetes bacterium]|nr:peptidase Ste24p [Bacteroidota bacterium]